MSFDDLPENWPDLTSARSWRVARRAGPGSDRGWRQVAIDACRVGGRAAGRGVPRHAGRGAVVPLALRGDR